MPEKQYYTINDLKHLIKTEFFMWKFPNYVQEFKSSRSRITVVDINGYKTTTCYLELQAKARRGNFKTALSKNQQRVDTMNSWKERCLSIHQEKYDYSLINESNFKFVHSNHAIICPTHGEFRQQGNVHMRGYGCPKCSLRSASYAQLTWLVWLEQVHFINIQHAFNGGEFKVPVANVRVDGYCKENNTIYEFYGDAYHGNLNIYQPEEMCSPRDKHQNAADLFNATAKREKQILKQGYKLHTIWESDWKEMLSSGVVELDDIALKKLKSFKLQTPGDRANARLAPFGLELVYPEKLDWHKPQIIRCLKCNETKQFNHFHKKLTHMQKTNASCFYGCKKQNSPT